MRMCNVYRNLRQREAKYLRIYSDRLEHLLYMINHVYLYQTGQKERAIDEAIECIEKIRNIHRYGVP